LGWHRLVLRTWQQGKPGIVEGLNNKIRVLQRRAYGYDDDDDYLNLKIVAAFLPPLPQHASTDPL
jgi:transposase